MKSQEQLEKTHQEMLEEIPGLIKSIGESDPEKGKLILENFSAKLAMLDYVLNDTGEPFKIVAEASIFALHEVINDLLKLGI